MSHIWHYCVQPHHTLIGKELCLLEQTLTNEKASANVNG